MKQKTHKATSKRVHVTKGGKALKRTAGQDHFNSRERGNTTRNKRSDKAVPAAYKSTVKVLIPYAHVK
ncbi:50S ribosomal protein L35 [Candidatus Uhrbacteria bacterium]|nr:50S ribosomal protein L35 [Candidatus Uhrbacteria bacterium]